MLQLTIIYHLFIVLVSEFSKGMASGSGEQVWYSRRL